MLRRVIGLLLPCLLLAACGPVAQQPVPLSVEAPRQQAWPEGGLTERVQPESSQLRILAFSGGRVPKLGHNHVLAAPRLQGRVWTPALDRLDNARFELTLRLDELEVDPPALRAQAGPDFATVLDAEAIAGTRAHMLGPDNLEAERFPLLRVRSLRVGGALPHLSAEVEIELHGERHHQTVALDVQRSTGGWQVRGAFKLRQSDYGIKPYTVLGGLLAVQDELSIDFDLKTAPIN